MTRINVYNYPDPLDYDGETTVAGWFESSKADRWTDADYHGDGSGGTGRGQAVLRTARGRWVLENWTRWQDEEDTYQFITDDQARDWLLRNNEDAAVETYFGDIEEEQGPGRPPVGKGSTIRLGEELTALADARAAKDGIKRAELIRQAVLQYVTTESTAHEVSNA